MLVALHDRHGLDGVATAMRVIEIFDRVAAQADGMEAVRQECTKTQAGCRSIVVPQFIVEYIDRPRGLFECCPATLLDVV
ncbi:hypothetical protein [Nocardia alba]|uniref:hypothetical protein n=1 Tax=Nocardia alba TaxID=225051 RepID=UPI00104A00F3|nr:hypothetical protein [Nocardia alba]